MKNSLTAIREKILPDKRRNSTKIVHILDTMATSVINVLQEKQESLPDFLPEYLDLGELKSFFDDLIWDTLNNINSEKTLDSYIYARNTYMKKEEIINRQNHRKTLFSIALIDTYFMLLLHKYYWVHKQCAKGILYINMKTGNVSRSSVPTHVIWDSINEWKDIDIELLMKELRDGGKKYLKIHDIWEDSCPFSQSDMRIEFIDTTWKYLEDVVLPLFQKKYHNDRGSDSRFLSWNHRIHHPVKK